IDSETDSDSSDSDTMIYSDHKESGESNDDEDISDICTSKASTSPWSSTIENLEYNKNMGGVDLSDSIIIHSLHHEECGKVPTLTLYKSDLDKATKDKTHKLFSQDFKVRLQFSYVNDSPSNISLRSESKASMHGQSTSDNASSHGETSSENEMLDSETDSDDDDWEGCEATHV
ncbi:lisH domain-containing protein C1711.05-like, partial [Stegodyphus dumicola]|uniref:lisH domain-containing protein C1711.05-like n=1 Tax=Stegodyphus dumicola TaxID=202533 RepID=UPI0015B11236